MLKVVLDTNQFISSVITKKGISAQLFQAWRQQSYILITSKEILEEIERVLRYPRIIEKYHIKEKEIESLINLIKHTAVVLPGLGILNVIKEDPDDNKFLSCAFEAKAQYIISGDKHLLELRQYKNISIITAREFLKIIDYNIIEET